MGDNQSTAVVPFSDLQSMATAMVRSGMFGKSTDQMVSLMLIAQAEGLHPAIAAMEYDVIQGRPSLRAQAALARFQQSGGSIKWESRTATEARAVFSHPLGGSLTISWTIERAQKMGLAGKENWRKQPEVMLSWRCVAEGVRAVYPACLNRMYLAEEVQDFEPLPRNVATETQEVAAPHEAQSQSYTPTSADIQNEYESMLDAAVKSGKLPEAQADTWRDRLSKPGSRKGAEEWIRANLEAVPMSAGKAAAIDAEVVDESLDVAADAGFTEPEQPEIF